MTTHAIGWGTDAADQALKPMRFERRDLRPDDVAIKITYAGIATPTSTPAATIARFLRRARHLLRLRDDPHGRGNSAYERLLRNDVRYRFVIDMATMPAAE